MSVSFRLVSIDSLKKGRDSGATRASQSENLCRTNPNLSDKGTTRCFLAKTKIRGGGFLSKVSEVLQLFIETLGFKTSAGGFVGFGIPKAGTNGEFAAELRHRAIDGDTAHNGNLTVFFRLPFYIEKDFESAALHNNLNFVDGLNVKSSYLLCGNPMQQTENKRLNANKSISGR